MRQVRRKVSNQDWDACVVVNEDRIVFGLLRADELGQGTDEPVEDIMGRGPSTFRPHVPVDELAHYMIQHELPSIPITTSDGRLVGLLTLEDAAHAAHGSHVHHDGDGGGG